MKNWGSYLLMMSLWGVSLYLAVMYGGFAAWFVLYCLSAIVLYSLMVMAGSLRKVSVSGGLSHTRVVSGDQLQVTVQLDLRSWIPAAWVVVEDRWVDQSGRYRGSHRKMLFPGFRSVVTYQYVIYGLQRGVYQFQDLSIAAGDLFGVGVKRIKRPYTRSFVVYPQKLEIGQPLEAASEAGSQGRNHPSRPTLLPETTSIREYVQGDSLRQIHWKSSAKLDELKVKWTEPALQYDLFAVLDGGPSSYINDRRDHLLFETAIQVIAGLLQFAARHQTGFGFMHLGGELETLPYSLQRPRLEAGLELLAQLTFEREKDRKWKVPRELLVLPKNVGLIWVTSHVDDHSLERIRILRDYGRQVQIIWVRASDVPPSIQARQAEHRLRQLGCSYTVVSRRPEELKAGVEDVGA